MTDNNTPECMWELGTPCEGEVKCIQLFVDDQLTITMCAKHLKEHTQIMTLCKNGYDVEEVLNQTPEWREEEVIKLNIDLKQVKI